MHRVVILAIYLCISALAGFGAAQNSSAAVASSPSENVGAVRSKDNNMSKPDLFQCYACESLNAYNKCERPLNEFLVMCSERKCHYIVGDLVENEKTLRNFVLAGCGSAPVLRLPGQQQPVVHTKHTDVGCKSVQFTHADMGETVMSDFSLSFKGHSCNCEGSACNHVYTELFTSDKKRNGASVSSAVSLFLILAFSALIRS